VATDPPPAARNTEPHMRAITRKVVSFLKQEEGPTAVEYAVMLALIIVVCIAAITTLGSNANNTFSSVATVAAPAGGAS
jgi:pilus assembly protein Flp/PilA